MQRWLEYQSQRPLYSERMRGLHFRQHPAVEVTLASIAHGQEFYLLR